MSAPSAWRAPAGFPVYLDVTFLTLPPELCVLLLRVVTSEKKMLEQSLGWKMCMLLM